MSETPVGYFPDVLAMWRPAPTLDEDYLTEMQTGRTGSEQRRGQFAAPGYRRWNGTTVNVPPTGRAAIRDFLRSHRGRLIPGYFWTPFPDQYTNVSVGSVTAVSTLVLPYRSTNPNGLVLYTLKDVRVGGVTTSFTRRGLLPRAGRYATLRFNGSTAYVNCGAGSSLKPTGNHTMTAWVYRVSTGSEIVVCGNFSLPAAGFGSAMRLASSGAIELFVGTSGGFSTCASTSTVPAETWTHVAVVKNAGNATFFINGAQKETATISSTFQQATANFMIGEDTQGALYFNGMIASVRLYNTALAAGEITNIYADNATPSANLVGDWRLDDGTGSTAADSSGYGNTGTLSGSPTPAWVSGEDEVTFAAPQTGAVTVTGYLRERIVARSNSDSISPRWLEAFNEQTTFGISMKEVY